MKEKSSVGILLCSYNGEQYIKEQLDSINNQTYSNLHCYIHDDNSTDNTPIIIEKYALEFPDKFTVIKYENIEHGAVENFMSLIRYASIHCKEEYFMLSDQDDVWLKSKVAESVKELQKYDDAINPALVYCDQTVVNEQLDIIAESTNTLVRKTSNDDTFKKIIFRNTAAGCCMCFNRILLNITARNIDASSIPMHDWWIMLVAAYYNNAHYFDKNLMLYRQHSDNAMGVDNNNYSKKIIKYLTNFMPAMKHRSEQTKKCKREVTALTRMGLISTNSETLQRFNSICAERKIRRMIDFYREGYVGKNNLFLLLFV